MTEKLQDIRDLVPIADFPALKKISQSHVLNEWRPK